MTFDSVVFEICKHSLNVHAHHSIGCTCGHVHVWVCTLQLQLCVCVCVYVKFEANIVQCMIL